jgi:hypothetical protein
MPKLTLKALQDKYEKLLTEARTYAGAVRNPKVRRHSTSPVTITNSEGQPKGRAVVSIEELVATAKAGEILGFETRIASYDGGKAIEVVFVQKTTDVPVPESLMYFFTGG